MRYPKIRNNVTNILTILSTEGPKTRQELVDRVRPAGTTKSWGTDLFMKKDPNVHPNYRYGQYTPELNMGWSIPNSRARASLHIRGMIEPVGRKGRSDLWGLTAYGYEVLMAKVMSK